MTAPYYTAAAGLLAVGLLTAPAPAAAHISCVQYVETDESNVTVVDSIRAVGPVPVVDPIVTTIQSHLGYDWCVGTVRTPGHHVRVVSRIIPTFIHLNWYPLNARDVYTCETFRGIRMQWNIWDGDGRNLNPAAIEAYCGFGAQGGYAFKDIDLDRTALHFTQDFGAPRGKAAITVDHRHFPDRHPGSHHYRLEPVSVFPKAVAGMWRL